MKLIIDSCVFIDAFDPKSPNHSVSLSLLENLKEKKRIITMPAHGWFEVQCTFQRLIKEKRFFGPMIHGDTQYHIELMHIDQEFISKYSMEDIPYTKAGDHIFIAVAKVNNWELVTSDEKMYSISKDIGIQVFRPAEYINQIQQNA